MAFEKGNQYAREWTLENALPRFEDALKFAQEDENCLCLQDAKFVTGIPSRSFDYLVENQIVLRTIKQDIMDAIVRRINRNALDKLTPSPSAASIWRMKQLGEKDESTVHQQGSMKQTIVVADKETQEEIEKLKQDFESE